MGFRVSDTPNGMAHRAWVERGSLGGREEGYERMSDTHILSLEHPLVGVGL